MPCLLAIHSGKLDIGDGVAARQVTNFRTGSEIADADDLVYGYHEYLRLIHYATALATHRSSARCVKSRYALRTGFMFAAIISPPRTSPEHAKKTVFGPANCISQPPTAPPARGRSTASCCRRRPQHLCACRVRASRTQITARSATPDSQLQQRPVNPRGLS